MRARVLVLTAYPARMASTRFRISQYVEPLRELGFSVDIRSTIDDNLASILYDKRYLLGNAGRLVSSMVVGLRGVLQRFDYDIVFVQRAAALVGPPILELVASCVGRKPVVLDLDDATWLLDGRWYRDVVRMPWKTPCLARLAKEVIVGSETLALWASKRARNVTVVPTVVPAALWGPHSCRSRGSFLGTTAVIGWIGTPFTAPQLVLALSALRRLRREGYKYTFRVVGAAPSLDLGGLVAERYSWNLDTEIEMFRDLDIGLAPMFSGPKYEGKCAFKSVQYMAVGVPHVTSMIGGARDFVLDGVNGLVASDDDSWYRAIRRLLDDSLLRARLSFEGRKLVERDLCAEVMVERLADVLRRAAA